MNEQPGWQIDDVHKAMEAIDPVVEVVFGFRLVARLGFATRKAIGAMEGTGNMYEGEVEDEDRDNPSVDTGGWCDVGVS